MLVYSVNLRDSEMETYRRRGLTIAHCPYADFKYVDEYNAPVIQDDTIINIFRPVTIQQQKL